MTIDVFLEEVEISTRTEIITQPFKVDPSMVGIYIKSGNFRFTDKEVYKILKEFEKDELQEIFDNLRKEGYLPNKKAEKAKNEKK
jgi:intein-encoded DNA endonuclease-like protein